MSALLLSVLLSAPACALTLESAAVELRASLSAFRERASYKDMEDVEADWAQAQADLCAENKALEAWAPALQVGETTARLVFKGCHTVDRYLGEPMTPTAMRLYAAPGSRWGLILSTEKGAEKTFVTVVYDDGRSGWRNAAQLGERPTDELLARAKDYGTVRLEKAPSGISIQSAAPVRLEP